MKATQKQWLGSMPWEAVLTINQSLCQAQNTVHQPKVNGFEAARQLWESAVSKIMSLPEVLQVCRQCQEMSPFLFNNGNTFAAVGKTLVEDWAQSLPPVEAQILRTTVCHYVASQVGKKELLQVLRHFEARWNGADHAQRAHPAVASPKPSPPLCQLADGISRLGQSGRLVPASLDSQSSRPVEGR